MKNILRNVLDIYHLKSGDMLLPEQEPLVLRTHSGHHVIRVHNYMDKRVDDPNEGPVTPRVVLGGPPRYHGHHCVVVHMEERDLSVLLPDYEEHCVQ